MNINDKPTSPSLSEQFIAEIKRLEGPILVLGASGFVGANLLHTLRRVRPDVHGTASRLPAWRLESQPAEVIHILDLLIDSNLDGLLDRLKPRTIFNCVAFGAYSFETDGQLIYQTNFNFTTRLLDRLRRGSVSRYVHAGSSSEYGDNCTAPTEHAHLEPNSHYAVSKAAGAHLVYYYGHHLRLPCVNLRLYSAYGPLEDSSRLIPNLVRHGLIQQLPEFVRPDISRDFVYIDDVSRAFVQAAINLREEDYGGSFNIGTGRKTTMAQIAEIAKRLFSVPEEPRFTMPDRKWDVADWYAQPDLARSRLSWAPEVSLDEGLLRTAAWMRTLPDMSAYERSSKRHHWTRTLVGSD